MELFGSQIFGSSCSPSFPSEPPDIKNWFSSYVYESFVLDTNDDYGDTSLECEDDKDRFVHEKIDKRRGQDWTKPRELRNRDEVNVNGDVSSSKFIDGNSFSEVNISEGLNLSEVPDALLSSPLLSEPPDIGNWSSSYQYESPVFDVDDGFSCSVSNRSFYEKGRIVGKSQGNQDENSGELRKSRDCHEEVSSQMGPLNATVLPMTDFDSLHSVSLLSELPCIKNWFSSYEYESPEVSILDDHEHSSRERDCVFIGERDIKQEKNLWITRKARNDNEAVGNKLCSHASGKNISITEDRDMSSEEKEELCLVNDLCFGQSLERNEKPSSNCKEFLGGEEERKFDKEASLISSNTGGIAGSRDRKLAKNLINREQFRKEKNLEANFKPPSKSSVSKSLSRNSNCDKENVVEREKERSKKEKCLTRAEEEMVVECSISNVLMRSGGDLKRKPLAETTNFQHSATMEVTGKWICPQKNKQKNGPPLKQLRLDQWLNRV